MTERPVHLWRPRSLSGALAMCGTTTRYAIEPRAEYVFGVIERGGMRARRARERYDAGPGSVVAWDPSGPHAGVGAGGPWRARLLILEAGDLRRLAADEERGLLLGQEFPDPVLRDPELAARFVALHRALEHPAEQLMTDVLLAEWIDALSTRAGARPPRRELADGRALRVAVAHLADAADRNVSLEELATVAGIGRFRLVRRFRRAYGVPPHTLHLAYRLQRARRLLEAGETVAGAALASGFADQSHLHRHFRRALGMTPHRYRRHFVAR